MWTACCLPNGTEVLQKSIQGRCVGETRLETDYRPSFRLENLFSAEDSYRLWSPSWWAAGRSAAGLASVLHPERWRRPTLSLPLLLPSAGSRLNKHVKETKLKYFFFFLFSVNCLADSGWSLPLSCRSPLKAPQPHLPVAISGSSLSCPSNPQNAFRDTNTCKIMSKGCFTFHMFGPLFVLLRVFYVMTTF